jgi:hypothetical protein
MWTLPFSLILLFCFAGHEPDQCSGRYTADTVLLYKKDSMLVLGKQALVVPLRISADKQLQFKPGHHTWIILDKASVVAVADGVYEAYLTAEPPVISELSPNQPCFVNVLDLYSGTAPGAGGAIQLDITAHINQLLQVKPKQPTLYLSILFRGTGLPQGGTSNKAGEVHVSCLRIVQVKA